MLSLAGVISFRSLTTPLHRLGWFGNPWLLGAMAGTFALQLALVYVPPLQHVMELAPLPLWIWGVIAATAAPVVIIPEAIKLIRARITSAARPR
jgi:Ca2+-transporting ATPase